MRAISSGASSILDQIEPLVALPDAVVNNSVKISQVAGQKIDQAFIGSCANGTLDDLEVAAKVVKGRQVASGVRLIVTPGTQAVYRAALKAGYIETLLDAGAVVTPATCGACIGGHMGVLAATRSASRRARATSRDAWAIRRRASSWRRPPPWPRRRSPA